MQAATGSGPGRAGHEHLMANPHNIQQVNQALAQSINQEARTNPQSPYAGKFVGIANGKVVVVADTLDEMSEVLDRVEPNPRNTFGVEAGVDYDEPQYIWSHA